MKTILILAVTFGLNSFAIAVSNPVKHADCKSSTNNSLRSDSKSGCTLQVKPIKHEVAKRKGCDVPELCLKKINKKLAQ